MDSAIQTILSYWFGEIKDGFPIENRNSVWWSGGPAIDQSIRENFGKWVTKASSEKLEHWKDDPQGRMALIILLDQFTRNIYRGTSEAFAADPLALRLCLEGIDWQQDQKLSWIERAFFYLPLVHSEDLDNHRLCIQLEEKLVASVEREHQKNLQGFLDSAIEHKEIIERFGRYPHRNQVLQRISTPEELEYLREKNNRFGQ